MISNMNELNLEERVATLEQAAPWDQPSEKVRLVEKFKNYDMTTESSLPNFSNPFDGENRRPPQS